MIPRGTPGGGGAGVSSVLFVTERDQRYLGYFNFVYGEVGIGVRLGGVENLHYGDGSEGVFAKLLEVDISSVKDKPASVSTTRPAPPP